MASCWHTIAIEGPRGLSGRVSADGGRNNNKKGV
jgi:hypothetical protein